MIHKLRPLIALLVIGSIIGGSYYYFNHNPDKLTEVKLRLGLLSADEASGIYKVSGYIEAETVNVAAEQRGRIAELLADEGDVVQAGQPIATLDTALLEAQLAQAEAKIQTAEANLAKVKAGLPAEDIAKAEAAVAVAQAKADAAESQWRDTIMLRDNPQELEMQIDAARTALELADLQIAANIPIKDASETMWELGKDRWQDVVEPERTCLHFPTGEQKCITIRMPEGVKQDAGVAWNLAGANMWAAWVDLNTSVTARDDAETRLNDLLRLRDDPQAAQVQVTQAEAAHETALAEVSVAEAQLEKMEAGPRAELVSVAQAQVAQSEAALAALDVERQKSVLVAPLSGSVVDRVAHRAKWRCPARRCSRWPT
jgi:multidrug efflux pump subunit AcrA (membrane-fusion protein)